MSPRITAAATVLVLWSSAAWAEGLLYVESVPARAQIAIDGKLTSHRTPVQLLLRSGRHKLSVLMPGHAIQHRQVVVVDGKVVRVQLTLPVAEEGPPPPPRREPPQAPKGPSGAPVPSGAATLVTDIVGATISVDGKLLAVKTPVTLKLPVGTRHIRLAYQTASVDRWLMIQRNNNVEIRVALRPLLKAAPSAKGQGQAHPRAGDPTWPAERQACLRRCKREAFVSGCTTEQAACARRCPGQVAGKIVNAGAYYSCAGVCEHQRTMCIESGVSNCKRQCEAR